MADLKNRRPLKSRNTRWAERMTSTLASAGVTPNQISIASMVAALGAGSAFWLAGKLSADTQDLWAPGLLLALAALGCQLRLLCNLFDGMVAVEAGKSAADGPFWNEFPDRISDILIFVGLGMGAGQPSLGWAAAALAVLTAYTRELGANIGLEPDFTGPMAKQHRMALMTAAALLAIVASPWLSPVIILTKALWLAVAGTVITVARRGYRLRSQLLRR